MCGITGYIDFSKKTNNNTLSEMVDVLHHRGPDDDGCFYEMNQNYQLGLGHKRLSIIDLSTHGHQPMSYDGLVMVYNGEVYNYKEIKAELEQLEYTFESSSDTEVLLKAYHCWGQEAVNKFNGMFTFAIFNEKTNKVEIFRDRVGVKPLYWYWDKNIFLFSSELKSFHKHHLFKKSIDKTALKLYFQYGYIPQPYTIFENARKLKPGSYLELDLATKKQIEIPYWKIEDYYKKPSFDISYSEAKVSLKELLKSSITNRLKADVEVGVFLSGGYDSSLVASMLREERQIKTFTIGFHEMGFNEATYAKDIAKHLNTEHYELYATYDEFVDVIHELPYYYDEPFGDSSAIPTTLVSMLASKHVKVSLSADGGDELFAGYTRYFQSLDNYNKISNMSNISKKLLSLFQRNIDLTKLNFFNKRYNFETKYNKIPQLMKAESPFDIYKISMSHFSSNELNTLVNDTSDDKESTFENSLQLGTDLKTILSLDIQTYLCDDILTKVDRATMSQSLEGREPLLDYRLIEYVAQLPDEFKYNNGIQKYILKDILHDYIPKTIMDRPKMGFVAPLEVYLNKELKYLIDDMLNNNELKKSGLLNFDMVHHIVNMYYSGRNEYTQRVWFLVMFNLWYKNWM